MTAKAQLQSSGDGTAVPAGSVGERLFSNINPCTVTTTASNVTSLSLNPGVWLLYGALRSSDTSTSTGVLVGFNTNSATFTGGPSSADARGIAAANTAQGICGINVGPYLINISTTTTYYLVSSSYVANWLAAATTGTMWAVRIA